MADLALLQDVVDRRVARIRKERAFRDREDFLAHGDDWLISRFRFPRAVLLVLCAELGPALERSTRRSRAIPVPTSTLAFLATGTYQRELADSANDRASRAIGRQLALIGDQLHRNRAIRLSPIHMLRPAPALTRAIYRDIQNHLWGVHGALSGAMKAWLADNAPNQAHFFRAGAWAAWVNCADLTNGVLLTLALVATASICTALWVEWEG